MSDTRSIIIGKEITLQPNLCQPCCHSFKIRQRRLYTQPKHWSAGARTHKNVVYDHLVNMAVQKRDDKLNKI